MIDLGALLTMLGGATVVATGLAFVACGLLTIFGALFFKDEDQIIERRIREVRRTVPDFEGNVVKFRRRA